MNASSQGIDRRVFKVWAKRNLDALRGLFALSFELTDPHFSSAPPAMQSQFVDEQMDNIGLDMTIHQVCLFFDVLERSDAQSYQQLVANVFRTFPELEILNR